MFSNQALMRFKAFFESATIQHEPNLLPSQVCPICVQSFYPSGDYVLKDVCYTCLWEYLRVQVIGGIGGVVVVGDYSHSPAQSLNTTGQSALETTSHLLSVPTHIPHPLDKTNLLPLSSLLTLLKQQDMQALDSYLLKKYLSTQKQVRRCQGDNCDWAWFETSSSQDTYQNAWFASIRGWISRTWQTASKNKQQSSKDYSSTTSQTNPSIKRQSSTKSDNDTFGTLSKTVSHPIQAPKDGSHIESTLKPQRSILRRKRKQQTSVSNRKSKTETTVQQVDLCPKCSTSLCPKPASFSLMPLLTFIWLQLFTNHCPKCHIPITRISGCKHMSCPCTFQFCYFCLREYHTHDPKACVSVTIGKALLSFYLFGQFAQLIYLELGIGFGFSDLLNILCHVFWIALMDGAFALTLAFLFRRTNGYQIGAMVKEGVGFVILYGIVALLIGWDSCVWFMWCTIGQGGLALVVYLSIGLANFLKYSWLDHVA